MRNFESSVMMNAQWRDENEDLTRMSEKISPEQPIFPKLEAVPLPSYAKGRSSWRRETRVSPTTASCSYSIIESERRGKITSRSIRYIQADSIHFPNNPPTHVTQSSMQSGHSVLAHIEH